MDLLYLLITLAIGAAVGWLAASQVAGGGFGLVGDIVAGVVGALIAAGVLPRIGFSVGSGLIGLIIMAVIGAVLLVAVSRLVKRA